MCVNKIFMSDFCIKYLDNLTKMVKNFKLYIIYVKIDINDEKGFIAIP